jgi:hypothetical protein
MRPLQHRQDTKFCLLLVDPPQDNFLSRYPDLGLVSEGEYSDRQGSKVAIEEGIGEGWVNSWKVDSLVRSGTRLKWWRIGESQFHKKYL